LSAEQAITNRRGGGAPAAIVHDRFTDLCFALACCALAAMLVAYLYEVVARYLFNAPTRWSSDVVQYALCVATALAFPAVTRERSHIAITSLLERLSPRSQAAAARGLVIAGALILAFISYVFVRIGMEQYSQGVETVAQFAIPKWWLTALVGIGFFDSMLHMVRHALTAQTITGHELDL
jgi:C4-dicarboxylate transporter DctQ subunit